MDAGYAPPGALAVVRARGAAPDPVADRRTAARIGRLEGKNEWLRHQFGALQAQLAAAGVPITRAAGPSGEPRPRSWAARERAVGTAVAEARAQDAARRQRQAAKRAAARAVAAGPDPA